MTRLIPHFHLPLFQLSLRFCGLFFVLFGLYYCLQSLENLLELVCVRDFRKCLQLAQVLDLISQESMQEQRIFNNVVQNKTANKVERQFSVLKCISRAKRELRVYLFRMFLHNRDVRFGQVVHHSNQFFQAIEVAACFTVTSAQRV